MSTLPVLAEEIGQATIDRVVDVFYDRVQVHPTLSVPFQRVQDWPHHKQKIAYFWWVSLGGHKSREMNFAVVPKHWRAGFNEFLLSDWKALFGEVMFAMVPSPLAEQWMARVENIGSALVTANHSFSEQAGRSLEIIG